MLALLIFLCGMIWIRVYRIIPARHIRQFYYRPNKIYSLRGWVNSQPVFKDNKTSFSFQAEEIAEERFKQVCCGEVLVIVPGRLKAEYAEELVLEGTLKRPFAGYLRRQGIYRIFRMKTSAFARKTGRIKGWPVKRSVLRLKTILESRFESSLTPICCGIVEAMTLGEEKNVPLKVYKDMVRSGTVHILVVSGSNVGVVGFIIVLLLKILRIPRLMRFFFCAALLSAYCLLTGTSNPVVRATIMFVVFGFAYFVRRQPDIYNSCSAAALAILAFKPDQIFDIGFQLSFSSVLAIAFFYPRFKGWLRLKDLKWLWLRLPAEGCLVSLSAWLGTAGFIAFYFRMISPITVAANLLIVPLAGLITLSGFSLLAAQAVSCYLASSFASVNELLVSLLLNLNSLLLQVPHACLFF